MSEYINLTDKENQMVDDFSNKININDSAMILRYGSVCQDKIAKYSDVVLNNVKRQDWSETGDLITELVSELKDLFVENKEKSGLFGLFSSNKKQADKAIKQIEDASNNIDKIVIELEGYQNQLMKDIIMLNKTYESNISYIKEITMYIMAGRKRLQYEQDTTLLSLEEKAGNSGDILENQALEEFKNNCDLFDKKLYELEMTQNISIQMATQIRMIQNSNMIMSEKIQTALKNTIPLWKNHMVTVLENAKTKEVEEIQKELSDEKLNQELITTLDDMVTGKKEEDNNRIKAETELETILNDYRKGRNIYEQ